MGFLYKLLKSESPSYLFNIIPNSNTQLQTINSGIISSFFVKHDCYISNADSFEVFKKWILRIIRHMSNSICNIHNPVNKFNSAQKIATADTADLVTFTEEILNGKLHFLCSDKNRFSLWKNKHNFQDFNRSDLQLQ